MSEREANNSKASAPQGAPESVSGVQLAQGIGVQEAKGFWADAWEQVVKRPGARFALAWLGCIGLIAILSPLIANGHPYVLRELSESGAVTRVSSPLVRFLTPGDVMLIFGLIAGGLWMLLARGLTRGQRLGTIVVCAIASGLVLVGATLVFSQMRASPDRQSRELVRQMWEFRVPVVAGLSIVLGVIAAWFLPLRSIALRVAVVTLAMGATTLAAAHWWQRPLQNFDYRERIASGEATAVFAPIPFSPGQRDISSDNLAPGSRVASNAVPAGGAATQPPAPAPRFWLGSDSFGQDALSQMLHACRLSISIGLVSTGIAVLIGVTIGALMGYFGGWVDLVLYRVVEVFMSVPVLFLLITAAAVLPRSTYVMMVVIGCVTWTGAARFTRAEFMRLRSQDFVQAAKAMGLPLRSILFKHMLPNGVTPVLVDASFAVAAAILAEAVLSFLGLGPDDQASWGRLLSDARTNAGQVVWWLAIFPGLAIFLSVLAYNLLGESLRDAIDPKLKKARV